MGLAYIVISFDNYLASLNLSFDIGLHYAVRARIDCNVHPC